MTVDERKQYWNEYRKVNASVERFAYKTFLSALKQSTIKLQDFIIQYPIESVLGQIDSLIETTPIQSAFDEFYIKGCKTFIPNLLRQTINTLPKEKKESPVEDILNIGFRNEEMIKEISELSKNVETALKVTQITETTRERIRKAITDGLAQNLTKVEIAKTITQITQGEITKQRAVLIARTETTYINSKGAEIALKNRPFKFKKTWIATNDMRTRDAHRSMLSSKPIEQDELFLVGGKYMKYAGDPAGGAANVCNCRCAVAYIPYQDKSITQQRQFDFSMYLKTILKVFLASVLFK